MDVKHSPFQVIKYGITGVFGSVLYFVVLVLLVELGDVPPILASFLAFSSTVVSCFFINCYWTFNAKAPSRRRFVKYSLVSVFGLFLTTAITYVGVEVIDVWYVYSQIVVVMVVPISNFLLNSHWVFSECELE